MNNQSEDRYTASDREFILKCTQSQMLFSKKNREYDEAWREFGLLGVVFELLGVLKRLPKMTIWLPNDGILNKKKLLDLFMDLHNFSIMAIILLEENNWDGCDPIYYEQTGDEPDMRS